MFRLALLATLLVAGQCAKLGGLDIPILRSDVNGPIGAQYNYAVETGDGIVLEENGSPGSAGQANAAGSYRYTAPDGTLVEVRYVADENGFRAESPFIPTPPPMPPHVFELLRIAEEQRAAGITFEK